MKPDTNTIQAMLRKSFKQYFEKCAIEYLDRSYTYENLNEHSSHIASCLLAKGLTKGTRIGVMCVNRYEVITTMLGIWNMGGVFVPIDPEYPTERIITMIETAELHYIVADKEFRELLERLNVNHLEWAKMLGKQAEIIPVDAHVNYEPDDAVYLYFTSGTTGRPNAIMGRNKGLLHFIEWEMEMLSLEDNIRVSQLTSPSHDPFLRDVLLPLFSGGTICIPASKSILLYSDRLVEWVEQKRIEVIHCTPSLFKNMQTSSITANAYSNLRFVLLAGEEVRPSDLTKWFSIFGNRIRMINLYGPTETTLAKFSYDILPFDTNRARIPIGKPITGARAILLNEKMEVCEEGTIGEIYIRTPYRSLGYYNNRALNEVKFIQNPFSNTPGDLIYKTGDLGRLLPDGNLEFMGRKDRQIKIRGYRVELEEVENALKQVEHVEDAVVVAKTATSGEIIIAAYVVTLSQSIEKDKGSINKLEDYKPILASQLPDYMMPTFLIELPAIPLTTNGKVDFASLPDLKRNNFEAPEGETEELIARIWVELLNIERVGRFDDFLELGGSSITMMNLIASIYDTFDVDLSLEIIFENAQLYYIAEQVELLQKESVSN